jgi:hypothetical protein
MATAKWWVCDDCRSLNDIPANRCYKCRAHKPSHPTLIDADYAQVASTQTRVGITVQRSQLSELTAPQAMETAKGSGVFEAYGAADDQPLESARTTDTPAVPPRPLRDPPHRSIAAAGGFHWEQGLSGADRQPDAPAAPPPDAPRAPIPHPGLALPPTPPGQGPVLPPEGHPVQPPGAGAVPPPGPISSEPPAGWPTGRPDEGSPR